jgi:hypothetical protein
MPLLITTKDLSDEQTFYNAIYRMSQEVIVPAILSKTLYIYMSPMWTVSKI